MGKKKIYRDPPDTLSSITKSGKSSFHSYFFPLMFFSLYFFSFSHFFQVERRGKKKNRSDMYPLLHNIPIPSFFFPSFSQLIILFLFVGEKREVTYFFSVEGGKKRDQVCFPPSLSFYYHTPSLHFHTLSLFLFLRLLNCFGLVWLVLF
jgi:hypothetical protein